MGPESATVHAGCSVRCHQPGNEADLQVPECMLVMGDNFYKLRFRKQSKLLGQLTDQQEIKAQIIKIMTGENEAHKVVFHKTVLSSLLASDLPPQELSITRLQQEAIGIVGAAIETTRSSLTLASFHILDNPEIFRRLRQELEEAFSDLTKPPTLRQLERLPYLTAVIQEGTSPCIPFSPSQPQTQ